jgi:hypothetical protein
MAFSAVTTLTARDEGGLAVTVELPGSQLDDVSE